MRVLLAGTFDLLHPGHIRLLWRAKRKFGGELIVIVARDENVRRFKGREPILEDRIRAFILSSLKPVDRVVIGSEDIFRHIERLKPDVIVLGYDQRIDEEYLSKALSMRGIEAKIVRAPRFGEYSSSSIRKKIRF